MRTVTITAPYGVRFAVNTYRVMAKNPDNGPNVVSVSMDGERAIDFPLIPDFLAGAADPDQWVQVCESAIPFSSVTIIRV